MANVTKITERIRVIHPNDKFKGRIAHITERIDQHSLVTYVVTIKGHDHKRAYQRNEIKFLKPIKGTAHK